MASHDHDEFVELDDDEYGEALAQAEIYTVPQKRLHSLDELRALITMLPPGSRPITDFFRRMGC